MPHLYRREIGEHDLINVAGLLSRGFPGYGLERWTHILHTIGTNQCINNFPKYGFLLEYNCEPVGVVLTLLSRTPTEGRFTIRCNLSSWYVEPQFRCYASLLEPRGEAWRDVTFFNVSPAAHTVPILEARGFSRYCTGQFMTMPALAGPWSRVQVEPYIEQTSAMNLLSAFEDELLRTHRKYQCFTLLSRQADNYEPFVFVKWRLVRHIRSLYLVYCRSIESFVQNAGPVGRYLARQGFPLVILDANTPPSGLIGKFLPDQPKFFKGPSPPRMGDLAYSERALFGF